jgi:hypothetical protein
VESNANGMIWSSCIDINAISLLRDQQTGSLLSIKPIRKVIFLMYPKFLHRDHLEEVFQDEDHREDLDDSDVAR